MEELLEISRNPEHRPDEGQKLRSLVENCAVMAFSPRLQPHKYSLKKRHNLMGAVQGSHRA